MDLAKLGLMELAQHIRRREISASEYARHLLERIDAHAHLAAFITVAPDALLSAARMADDTLARAGDASLGPLHGVPIAIKDNIDTADLPTTGGTPALRIHRPARDAVVVTALRKAGALVLGKTNLHELAYGVTGENGAFGPVRNPYDAGRIAGGSSAGTAAAVSAGLAPAGLGTDTGGSVRIPAALCGVAALRPTVGRYSQRGIMVVSNTRDTAGPMARSVADVAALDMAITGEPPRSIEMHVAELRGVRLGVARRPFFAGLAPGIADIMQRRLMDLEACGVELIEVDLPDGIDERIVGAGFPIAFHETPITLREYLVAHPLAPSLDEVVAHCASPDVKRILTAILGEGRISLADYHTAMTVHRPALDAAFRTLFETHRITALIGPTTPITAMPLGVTEVTLGDATLSTFEAYTRTTGPGSAIGWPGLTLPAGLDDAGLPVGLALDAPPGTDRALLQLGRAIEQILPPLPPIC